MKILDDEREHSPQLGRLAFPSAPRQLSPVRVRHGSEVTWEPNYGGSEVQADNSVSPGWSLRAPSQHEALLMPTDTTMPHEGQGCGRLGCTQLPFLAVPTNGAVNPISPSHRGRLRKSPAIPPRQVGAPGLVCTCQPPISSAKYQVNEPAKVRGLDGLGEQPQFHAGLRLRNAAPEPQLPSL